MINYICNSIRRSFRFIRLLLVVLLSRIITVRKPLQKYIITLAKDMETLTVKDFLIKYSIWEIGLSVGVISGIRKNSSEKVNIVYDGKSYNINLAEFGTNLEEYYNSFKTNTNILLFAFAKIEYIQGFKNKHRELLKEINLSIPETPLFYSVVKQISELPSSAKSTVLLLGEPGTGKTSFARLIHELSDRSDKNMIETSNVKLNTSISANELVGHKKGAFTGADKDKDGLIKVADGTTLFIDEIGSLNYDIQDSLLTLLNFNTQSVEFFPMGSTVSEKSDFRLISATTVDPSQMSPALYDRISDIEIKLPPLKNYINDIDDSYFKQILKSAIVKLYPEKISASSDDIPNEFLEILKNSSVYKSYISTAKFEKNVRGHISEISRILCTNNNELLHKYLKLQNMSSDENIKEEVIQEVKQSGRPSKITIEIGERIKSLAGQGTTQKRIQELIKKEYNISIDRTTISRFSNEK